MKKFKNPFAYFIALSIIFVACSKDEMDNENLAIEENNQVIKTFTSKLPENVIKIETITSEHPLINKSSWISKGIKAKESSGSSSTDENAIYYFTNNSLASLSYDGINVYATVFDENGSEIENIVADFSKVDSENIVTINYLDRDETQVFSTKKSSLANRSWGSCMDDAIDQLYDDWNDDPVGTFTCWVTGPLCAIGGGIACGIQQLQEQEAEYITDENN